MCPKVNAPSLCDIWAYERFHRNTLLQDSGVNLYILYYATACITFIVITIEPVSLGKAGSCPVVIEAPLSYLRPVTQEALDTVVQQIREAGAEAVLDFQYWLDCIKK